MLKSVHRQQNWLPWVFAYAGLAVQFCSQRWLANKDSYLLHQFLLNCGNPSNKWFIQCQWRSLTCITDSPHISSSTTASSRYMVTSCSIHTLACLTTVSTKCPLCTLLVTANTTPTIITGTCPIHMITVPIHTLTDFRTLKPVFTSWTS